MASTSCNERARELLACCLEERPWPDSLLYSLIDGCTDSFFRVVVEGLADRFEPRLCDEYARLFAKAIAHTLPELDSGALLARYERVRCGRVCELDPANVIVLSRVTLGADIAITSVILDAATKRFPHAAIYLAGSRKAAELFESDGRILHLPVVYPRSGSLRDRLDAWRALEAQLAIPDSIVIDPDSRLTQLGLLPVCPDERYFFFESRAHGGNGREDLSTLTRRWVAATFGIPNAHTWLAPLPAPLETERPCVTVSLGVGDNAAKRIADPFESRLLAHLAGRAATVWIDRGAGGEEAARVDRAIEGLPPGRVRLWQGSFAGFASLISQSDLYVGYDSAGQHAAAASAVPLVTVFAGFPCERMFERWQPTGRGPVTVIRVDDPDPAIVLAELARALGR